MRITQNALELLNDDVDESSDLTWRDKQLPGVHHYD